MRSFIGIDFSPALKDEIAGLQRRLKAASLSGRWKHRDNFHLTLKFLDEIDKSREEKIKEALRSLCGSTEAFKLKIQGLGCFPGKDSVRVVWLSLGGDMSGLLSLQKAVDEDMEALGFEKERRRYTPHVSIGQDVVFEKEFDGVKALFNEKDFSEICVDRVCLFKSELSGGRRLYTPVFQGQLLNKSK